MNSDHVTDRSYLSYRVKRYSTWPTITQQTVGCHCAAVYHTYWRIFGVPKADVAWYIMHHDSEELISGDPPYPVKAENPDLKEAYTRVENKARAKLRLPSSDIDDLQKAMVKICDLLEMMHFGMLEREMGNLLATPIIERTRSAALDLAAKWLVGILTGKYEDVQAWIANETFRHNNVVARQGSTL